MRKQEMQIDNLQKRSYDVNASDLTTTYLVPSSVSYKHYERAMILLDIVIDKNGYPWVELFPHLGVIFESCCSSSRKQQQGGWSSGQRAVDDDEAVKQSGACHKFWFSASDWLPSASIHLALTECTPVYGKRSRSGRSFMCAMAVPREAST